MLPWLDAALASPQSPGKDLPTLAGLWEALEPADWKDPLKDPTSKRGGRFVWGTWPKNDLEVSAGSPKIWGSSF